MSKGFVCSQSQVLLRKVRLFAHHGVLPQERLVGAYFTLDISIDTDFSCAAENDDLSGTISYADVYDVVCAEMQKPSALLENVAERIAQALFSRFLMAQAIDIEIIKENPPMGADCEGAGVHVRYTRV